MPSRNSILNLLDEEKSRNAFAPVNLSIKLLHKVREIVVDKMPKKYSFYDSKVLYEYAFDVCSCAREANSVFLSGSPFPIKDAKKRIKLWKKARRKLLVVRTSVDVLLDLMGENTLSRKDNQTGETKCISKSDMYELLDLIIKELSELTSTINREKKRLNNEISKNKK